MQEPQPTNHSEIDPSNPFNKHKANRENTED